MILAHFDLNMPLPQGTPGVTASFVGRRTGPDHFQNPTASPPRGFVSNERLLRMAPEHATVNRHQRSNMAAGNRRHIKPNSAKHNSMKANGIDVQRIYKGHDVRTTVMLRNLPNRLTHADLHTLLKEKCYGEFDFLYVRIDFSNGCNVGYGFVNMISPQSVIGFVEEFRGYEWPGSEKVAEVSYATQQGREALISRFRNSFVMLQPELHRPKLYYPLGSPLAGKEEPFPEPDNLAKLYRSQQNADAEGLYEAREQRGGAAGRRRVGPHDRQHMHNGFEVENFDPMFDPMWLAPVWEQQYGQPHLVESQANALGHDAGDMRLVGHHHGNNANPAAINPGFRHVVQGYGRRAHF